MIYDKDKDLMFYEIIREIINSPREEVEEEYGTVSAKFTKYAERLSWRHSLRNLFLLFLVVVTIDFVIGLLLFEINPWIAFALFIMTFVVVMGLYELYFYNLDRKAEKARLVLDAFDYVYGEPECEDPDADVRDILDVGDPADEPEENEEEDLYKRLEALRRI